MTGTINLSDTTINDSSYSAIHFYNQKITGLTFEQVTIDRTGTFAIQNQAYGAAVFNNVTAKNTGYAGRYDCDIGFAITEGTGNSGWNEIRCGFPTPVLTPFVPPTPFGS